MNIKRRTILKAGAALTATISAPAIVRAEEKFWRLAGSLPMTGPFATAGQLVAHRRGSRPYAIECQSESLGVDLAAVSECAAKLFAEGLSSAVYS